MARKPPTTLSFRVTVPKIEGVSVAVWEEYIADAVNQWNGQAVAPQNGEEPDEWYLMMESRPWHVAPGVVLPIVKRIRNRNKKREAPVWPSK